jgi:hypothetical protein
MKSSAPCTREGNRVSVRRHVFNSARMQLTTASVLHVHPNGTVDVVYADGRIDIGVPLFVSPAPVLAMVRAEVENPSGKHAPVGTRAGRKYGRATTWVGVGG